MTDRLPRGTFFFLINLLLCSFFISRNLTPNPTTRALTVYALYENHTHQIDGYQEWTQDKALVRGHYYSDKAPFASWVTVPVYAFIRLFENSNQSIGYFLWDIVRLGGFWVGSLPLALFAWILFRRSEKSSEVILLSLYSSLLFVYAGTFFGHLLAGLLLVLSYDQVSRKHRPLLAGFLSGICFLTEFPMALSFLVLVWVLKRKNGALRDYLYLGLGFLPAGIVLLLVNFVFTGSPFEFLYHSPVDPSFQEMSESYGFSLPHLDAIVTMLFLPSKSIFLYCPILLWIFPSMIRNAVREKKPPISLTFFGIFFLVVSSYYMWTGGWAFGPRHLIPVLMLVIYDGVALIRPTLLLYVLGSLGTVHCLLAKLTSEYMISHLDIPFTTQILPRALSGDWNLQNGVTETLGISPPLAGVLWLLILGAAAISYRRNLIPAPK